jgi:hypothetical protein
MNATMSSLPELEQRYLKAYELAQKMSVEVIKSADALSQRATATAAAAAAAAAAATSPEAAAFSPSAASSAAAAAASADAPRGRQNTEFGSLPDLLDKCNDDFNRFFQQVDEELLTKLRRSMGNVAGAATARTRKAHRGLSASINRHRAKELRDAMMLRALRRIADAGQGGSDGSGSSAAAALAAVLDGYDRAVKEQHERLAAAQRRCAPPPTAAAASAAAAAAAPTAASPAPAAAPARRAASVAGRSRNKHRNGNANGGSGDVRPAQAVSLASTSVAAVAGPAASAPPACAASVPVAACTNNKNKNSRSDKSTNNKKNKNKNNKNTPPNSNCAGCCSCRGGGARPAAASKPPGFAPTEPVAYASNYRLFFAHWVSFVYFSRFFLRETTNSVEKKIKREKTHSRFFPLSINTKSRLRSLPRSRASPSAWPRPRPP